MEQPTLPEWGTYGPTAQLFANMELDHIFGPMGRNYGIGWYDDFTRIPTLVGNTGYDGYGRLTTANDGGVNMAMIDSSVDGATSGIGILRITMDAGAANDEGVFQLGNLLDDGPFRFTLSPGKDVAFECRIAVSAITTNKWSWFVGLATGGSAGAAITDKCFDDTTGALYATNSFLGFQKLYVETSAVDGMYQMTGQTKQDGATKTKLDTLKTLVATYFTKLGFRYRAPTSGGSGTLHWYVDGVETKAAMLTSAELEHATFPDAVCLTPTFGIKDVGQGALTFDIDWGICVQAF